MGQRRKQRKNRKDRSCLAAIALNEGRYVDEWIRYHGRLGFDEILIYDNSEEGELADLPTRHPGLVRVIHFPGALKQVAAYNHAAKTLKAEKSCGWLALIDIDEFIVLRKHSTIGELLRECCGSGALALNWVMVGSSGEQFYRQKPVLERFQKRQKGVDMHVKCIVRLKDLEGCKIHRPRLKGGTVHDCDERVVEGIHNPDGNDHTAAIFHYFTKSREEFQEKIQRGRADQDEKRTMLFFDVTDAYANEIIDRSAWRFARFGQWWRRAELLRRWVARVGCLDWLKRKNSGEVSLTGVCDERF